MSLRLFHAKKRREQEHLHSQSIQSYCIVQWYILIQCFRCPVNWPTADIPVPVVFYISHIIKDSKMLQFYFMFSDVSCTQRTGTSLISIPTDSIEDGPPSRRLHPQTSPFVWILMPVKRSYPGTPDFLQPMMYLHQMHVQAGLRRLKDDRDSAWKFFLRANFAAETLYNKTPDK